MKYKTLSRTSDVGLGWERREKAKRKKIKSPLHRFQRYKRLRLFSILLHFERVLFANEGAEMQLKWVRNICHLRQFGRMLLLKVILQLHIHFSNYHLNSQLQQRACGAVLLPSSLVEVCFPNSKWSPSAPPLYVSCVYTQGHMLRGVEWICGVTIWWTHIETARVAWPTSSIYSIQKSARLSAPCD